MSAARLLADAGPVGGVGGVGMVGIGNMGLGLALRLRDAGIAVSVCDIDANRTVLAAEAGARVCATPAEAARGCALLAVVVVDAAQTEAVLFGTSAIDNATNSATAGATAGAAAALPPGAAVLLCPTLGPADVESIAARLGATGLGCIDAPMSGGPVRARDGSMSLMVACSDALWARHQPLLLHLAAGLLRVGSRCGDGARTKLVNNLLAAVNLAAAAEALALATHLGLDAGRTLDVIARSSGQSWIGSDRMARALAGDFAPRAHTTLLAKDTRLALAMVARAGLPAPVLGQRAAALFQDALAAGYADEDDARMLSLLMAMQAPRVPPVPPAPPVPPPRPGAPSTGSAP